MATGLIDVGIIKPELAGSFAAGYRGAEQARQKAGLVQQETEINQMKLDQLKQDRAGLLQLQDSLKAAGKDPDPIKVFDALIATGNPDYVMKGIDGKRRLTELQRADSMLRQYAPELFGATPTNAVAPAGAPAGVPAFGMPAGAQPPGDYTSTQAMGRVPGVVTTPIPESPPMNAMAPAAAPAAPVNAMAPAAGGDVNALRRQLVALSSIDDPRAKALAEVLKGQITEASKPYVVGGRLVTGGGKELYAAPDKDTTLQSDYKFAKTPEGGGFKGSLADFKVLATPKTTTTINNAAEKAEAGKFGELLVKQFEGISNSAGLAIKTLPGIEANLTILNKGLDTGFGTDAKKAGARILGALGVQDAEKFAANAEMFQSNAINALMQKQLEQKGPQTESDAIRLEQIGAQLGKTKDANQFILDFAKEQLRRDIDQRNFYAEWKKGPGRGSFNGAEDAWFAGEGGKSLFDRPALKKYAAGAASAASQIPTAATPARATPAAAPIYARNPQTNQRIMSTDGGNTWTPAR